jgi:hypothetical protein
MGIYWKSKSNETLIIIKPIHLIIYKLKIL